MVGGASNVWKQCAFFRVGKLDSIINGAQGGKSRTRLSDNVDQGLGWTAGYVPRTVVFLQGWLAEAFSMGKRFAIGLCSLMGDPYKLSLGVATYGLGGHPDKRELFHDIGSSCGTITEKIHRFGKRDDPVHWLSWRIDRTVARWLSL